jgi:hypothetical protein
MAEVSFDEFEAECGNRLRSIGYDDARLVYTAAVKAYIPSEKAVDALVDGCLRSKLPKRSNIKVDLNRSFLEDLRAHFGTIVLEDIGLFKWEVFLDLLSNTQTQKPQT